MSRVVAFVCLLAVSGCSIALQKKPTAVAKSECSTSAAYWIADYVGVAAGAGAFAYGLAEQDKSDAKMFAGTAAGLAAIVYLASAVNGQRDASRCRDQQETAPIAAR
jgi:peptidoglycan/LPS O-acetylase OafA/YrhL